MSDSARPTAMLASLVSALIVLPASANTLEELLVTAESDNRTIELSDAVVVSPDVAELIKSAPGGNGNNNGPLSSIPQYRGMYGPRVSARIDGMQIAPAGPNWMDPPLSYAVTGQLESLIVHRGIAPVSVAQESIGGAVEARMLTGEFAETDELQVGGQLLGVTESVNRSYQANAVILASTQQQRLKLAATTQKGDDAAFPGGDITPTEYERQRYDIGYGVHTGAHTLQFDYGYNDTGETGTPALPMDIDFIEGDLYRAGYEYNSGSPMTLDFVVFGSTLDHEMTNYKLRQPPPSGAMFRRNTARADNIGFNLGTTMTDADGQWQVGVDGFSADHNADIDNPNNPMFFVDAFNSAEREVLGVFVERQQVFNQQWQGELGVRYNRVDMDAGEVDATPARMMPPAQALRDAFNNADRSRTDDNLDAVAKLWYRVNDQNQLMLGLAQKHRSPSYQERYLWLPLQSTGGLADGYTYTGTIDLDPERARQVELGWDFNGNSFNVSPRLFYSKVENYIEGTPSTSADAVMFVRMMNQMNGTNNPDPLQFTNVDAELYGFDMDWSWQLTERWNLSGLVNYVRGKRDDGGNDDLYRIAPPNASLRLGYATARWSAAVENILYAEQDDVSQINDEQTSSGYGIVNVQATWQATNQLQLAAGVDNLFDKEYESHLGGYNRAGNPDIARGARLPGYGANAFARILYTF
ncbi:MAG: TonB-dependent receptor [Pseudomonadota bacterium]